MSEIGFFLVKPDAVLMKEEPVVIKEIRQAGLDIIGRQEIRMTPEQVDRLYANVPYRDNGKLYMDESWKGYLTGGPSIALVVWGEEASVRLNEIKRRVRTMFDHGWFYTGSHVSDSSEEAISEMGILNVAQPGSASE